MQTAREGRPGDRRKVAGEVRAVLGIRATARMGEICQMRGNQDVREREGITRKELFRADFRFEPGETARQLFCESLLDNAAPARPEGGKAEERKMVQPPRIERGTSRSTI